MTNPAFLLASLCAAWTITDKQRPEMVRGNGDHNSLDFWDVHRVALTHLSGIRSALDALKANGETVDFYEDTLPAWYQAVFSFRSPWQKVGATSVNPVMGALEFRLLNALGAHIESAGLVPKMPVDLVEGIRAAVADIKELTVNTSSLPDEVRRYLLGLIAEVTRVIDEQDSFGNVALRQKVMELLGVVSTTAELIPETQGRAAWKDKAKNLLIVMSGAVAMKALDVGGELATNALTQGVPGVTN